MSSALLARLQDRAGACWPWLEGLFGLGWLLVAAELPAPDPEPGPPTCRCIPWPVPIRWDEFGRQRCILCGRRLAGDPDLPWQPEGTGRPRL